MHLLYDFNICFIFVPFANVCIFTSLVKNTQQILFTQQIWPTITKIKIHDIFLRIFMCFVHFCVNFQSKIINLLDTIMFCNLLCFVVTGWTWHELSFCICLFQKRME